MNCPNTECQQPFPDHVRFCIVCGADVGFPNVRAAQRAEEIAALDDRIKRVFATAAEGGYVSVLAQFEAAVAKSVAVINRPLLKVSELVSSDNALSSTFHQQVIIDPPLVNSRCLDTREQLLVCRSDDDRARPTLHARCVERSKKGARPD